MGNLARLGNCGSCSLPRGAKNQGVTQTQEARSWHPKSPLTCKTISKPSLTPRRQKVKYPLINIVVIPICAVICGADDFVAIAAFGRNNRQWLARFLDPSAGIPSHDRFNAVFARIKPEEFARCLVSWVTSLHELTGGQVVAIDGKTLRRSVDNATGKAAIHMISAWATAHHLSLGQVVVDTKSNEITAIAKLLEILDISGALVTLDAMGCQAQIAQKVRDGGGDYVLAVK